MLGYYSVLSILLRLSLYVDVHRILDDDLQEYDWYGAYGRPEHAQNEYADSLRLDYTFDHPKIQDNASIFF